LLRLVSQGAQLVGNGAAGALLTVLTPRDALLVDAATFLGSALLVRLGTRARPARAVATAGRSLLADSAAGVRRVMALPTVRRALLLLCLVPTFAVAPEALAAPAVDARDLSANAVGWWLAALPVGTMLGQVLGVWVI